jgi:hypothetical protein
LLFCQKLVEQSMTRSLVDRVMSRVEKDEDGCWVCQLSGNGRGYAQIVVDGRKWFVHRLMYELLVGPIPSGFHIDHKCRNRRCCNPEHLDAVTPHENNRRANEHAPLGHVRARDRCIRGHEFSSVTPKGRKVCGECKKARFKERYATDAEFRERCKRYSREDYARRSGRI